MRRTSPVPALRAEEQTETKTCNCIHREKPDSYFCSVGYHKIRTLKQHTFIISQFCRLKVCGLGWFLCFGSYKPKSRCLQAWLLHRASGKKNSCPGSFGLLAKPRSPLPVVMDWGIPFLLAVSQRLVTALPGCLHSMQPLQPCRSSSAQASDLPAVSFCLPPLFKGSCDYIHPLG